MSDQSGRRISADVQNFLSPPFRKSAARASATKAENFNRFRKIEVLKVLVTKGSGKLWLEANVALASKKIVISGSSVHPRGSRNGSLK